MSSGSERTQAIRACVSALPGALVGELVNDLPLVEVLDDVDGERDEWVRVVHHGLASGDEMQPVLAIEVDALRALSGTDAVHHEDRERIIVRRDDLPVGQVRELVDDIWGEVHNELRAALHKGGPN